MRIRRGRFNQILVTIRDQKELTPANLNPLPTSPDQRLALTVYRLAAGCSYATLSDVLGGFVSFASMFFNKICRVIVANINDTHGTLPTTYSEWEV